MFCPRDGSMLIFSYYWEHQVEHPVFWCCVDREFWVQIKNSIVKLIPSIEKQLIVMP